MVLGKVKDINRRANEGIRKKIRNAKEDPRHLGLVFAEFFLIVLILLSLFFLFDPNLAFPDSELIPWPLKLVMFLLAIGLVYKIYSYTKDFRKKQA